MDPLKKVGALDPAKKAFSLFDEFKQFAKSVADTMTRDVTQFLQTLIERRLVRVVDLKESR